MAIIEATDTQKAISDVLRNVALEALGQIDATNKARSDWDGERETLTNDRLTLCGKIANTSADQKWTAADIDTALKVAKNSTWGNRPLNDPAYRTLGVFVSELAIFAHPNVRAGGSQLISCCKEAFLQEALLKQGNKDAPTPIRDWQPSVYKLAITLARGVRDGNYSVTTAEDVWAIAEANDPSKDPKRAEKRIKAIRGELQEMFNIFGHGALKIALDAMNNITAESLITSRAQTRPAPKEAPISVPVTPVPPVTTGVKPAEPVENNVTTLPGVYDPFDQLNGMDDDAQSAMLAALLAAKKKKAA